MPRPKKDRNVCSMPRVSAFFPEGESGGCVVLTVEEYECIRLIDHLGFSQEECAAQMQVARTTVQNMYHSARETIASALVEGKTLRIEGGDFRLCGEEEACPCKARGTEQESPKGRSI